MTDILKWAKIAASDIKVWKDYLEITEKDMGLLKEIGKIIEKRENEIIDPLYEHFLKFEETKGFFKNEDAIKGVKKLQKAHLRLLFSGEYGEEFLKRSIVVGRTHSRIGLLPRWYIGAYRKYLEILHDVIIKEIGEGKAKKIYESLLKVMFLDMTMAIQAYVIERGTELEESKDAVLNLVEDLEEEKAKLSKAYEELKIIDETKTDIISNVKHELRTPITISRSAIELAIDEDDRGNRAKLLKAASRALSRQDGIVGDLIETLEIKTQKKVKLEEPVYMAGAINFVINEFGELITTKKIDLAVEIEDDLPKVLATQKDVVHILRNLLDNAIKFTDDGGKVKIGAKKKGEGEVEVSILDSGIGISKEVRDKIFEDLFQGDASTTRKYGGTGLGLSVVRNLVEFYGGKIELWSEEGKGSEFCFTLPRALEE